MRRSMMLRGAVEGIVEVDVRRVRQVRLEHEARAALEVEAEGHGATLQVTF